MKYELSLERILSPRAQKLKHYIILDSIDFACIHKVNVSKKTEGVSFFTQARPYNNCSVLGLCKIFDISTENRKKG